MKLRHTSTWRSILSLCSLGLAFAAGCDDTDATTDAATDSGSVTDTGSNPVDGGNPTDTGSTPTDTGSTPTDTGSTPTDTGSTPTDAGTPTDTGSAPTDAGTPAAPRTVPVTATGHDRFFGVTYDAAGNFYAVGVVSNSNVAATADFETVVAKFNSAGVLDTTFGTGGFARRNLAVGLGGEVARGIVVQPSGKIVVTATVEHVATGADARDRDVALARFNADGTPDNTFGTNGVVLLDLSAGEVSGTSYIADSAWGMAMYPDGRLVVHAAQKRTGATDTDFAIVRLSADGVRDAGFGTNGVVAVDINNRAASARLVTVLADGSILASGYFSDGGIVKPVLIKITAAGALDTTFGTGGVFQQTVLPAVTEVYGAVVQGTHFVTAGYGRGPAVDGGMTPENDIVSLRVSATGTLDTAYGTTGAVGAGQYDFRGFSDQARDVVALSGNRTLIVGSARPTSSNGDAMLLMLQPNGMPDTTFGMGGFRTHDLGGVSDAFWGAAVNPARTHVAIVGVRGVAVPAADAGVSAENDDGVVYLLPL